MKDFIDSLILEMEISGFTFYRVKFKDLEKSIKNRVFFYCNERKTLCSHQVSVTVEIGRAPYMIVETVCRLTDTPTSLKLRSQLPLESKPEDLAFEASACIADQERSIRRQNFYANRKEEATESEIISKIVSEKWIACKTSRNKFLSNELEGATFEIMYAGRNNVEMTLSYSDKKGALLFSRAVNVFGKEDTYIFDVLKKFIEAMRFLYT
jgi:hypothetical protein